MFRLLLFFCILNAKTGRGCRVVLSFSLAEGGGEGGRERGKTHSSKGARHRHNVRLLQLKGDRGWGGGYVQCQKKRREANKPAFFVRPSRLNSMGGGGCVDEGRKRISGGLSPKPALLLADDPGFIVETQVVPQGKGMGRGGVGWEKAGEGASGYDALGPWWGGG